MSRSLVLFARSHSFEVPLFLAPAFLQSQAPLQQRSSRRDFSTSQHQCEKGKLLGQGSREKNKKRGVSAIRSTGPRVKSQVYKFPLPEPNLDPSRRAEFKTNPNHGLWGFFNETRQAMIPAEDESAFGRAWTYQELTIKSFEDLHRLWYTCMVERNRTHTRKNELNRIKAGYGAYEAEERIKAAGQTMSKIRRVLGDRQLNYLEARSLLNSKPLAELLPDREEYEEKGFDDFETQDQPFEGRPRPTQPL